MVQQEGQRKTNIVKGKNMDEVRVREHGPGGGIRTPDRASEVIRSSIESCGVDQEFPVLPSHSKPQIAVSNAYD